MNDVLVKDSDLVLPEFTLVSASAGCGKTTTLTRRFIQLLMSDRIPHNQLANILAITFTNNAAIEMKQRILEFLKRAYFRDPAVLGEFTGILSLDADSIAKKSGELVDLILDNYSDFQVQTIDSFLSRLLKVSAVDLGLPPDFSIALDSRPILDEALAEIVSNLPSDAKHRILLEQLVDIVTQNQQPNDRFLWNPYERLSREVRRIYSRISSFRGEPAAADCGPELRKIAGEILSTVRSIGAAVDASGLDPQVWFTEILDDADPGHVDAILGRSFSRPVIKKVKSPAYDATIAKTDELKQRLGSLVADYLQLLAERFYEPYVKLHNMLHETIESVKRRRAEIPLADATKTLVRSLDELDVPQIYFSLGERIHHFLIDEFQDTSPIQWASLRPLIENSLAEEGSLFLVGDTKQSIFTFRGADWQIMGEMRKREEFASVHTQRRKLEWNWRSEGAIVDLTRTVFKKNLPTVIPPAVADASGLVSSDPVARPEAVDKGYVEVLRYDRQMQGDEPGPPPEKERLLGIIGECRHRGYAYRDIAILTPRNEDVVEVSRWLNERDIKFVSHSSLDIRGRKITGELMALLKFLDSPVDHLAFATFLLGDIFNSFLARRRLAFDVRALLFDYRRRSERDTPLYADFRAKAPELWNLCFEDLFALVGYLPLYDLVVEVFRVFDLFNLLRDEEAALVKLLEVVRSFEERGSNSLKDFLAYASGEDDESGWDIATAPGEDAVSVMTVHKAKGLGFPVLIVLLYDRRPHADTLFIDNRGDGIALLRITRDWAEKSPALEALYQRRNDLRQVDDLNKLYVALTRARREMYVLSVADDRVGMPSRLLDPPGPRGSPLPPDAGKEPEPKHVSLPRVKLQQISRVEHHETIGLAETKRGEYIHAVLARIVAVAGDAAAQIAKAIGEVDAMTPEGAYGAGLQEKLAAFLTKPGLKEYFEERSGRTILNEQEIVGADGKLYRIDRLVVDPDVATVIDYKSGGEMGEYAGQVKEYMALVKDLFPGRRVRGLLAYVDGMSLTVVE